MMVKTKTWPMVLPNDDGIRPISGPDQCCYCHQKIGEAHGADCVCVEKLVRYDVLFNGIKIGAFSRYDPHSWDKHQCDFHKNESSWCTDNAVDAIVWMDTPMADDARDLLETLTDEQCSCSFLHFQFSEIVDNGPFVEMREDANPIALSPPHS